MKELDNIKINDLPILLNENSTLSRFYPLIPKCKLLMTLQDFGLYDKYSFLDKMNHSADDLSSETGIDEETLHSLEALFHLHDYKIRKINKLETISSSFKTALLSDGIKTSFDYLTLCMNNSVNELSHKFKCDDAEIIYLFSLCDLMRLPGVKEIRASLYYDSGFKNVTIFAVQDSVDMQKQIDNYIKSTGINKSTPLKKELSTQIALAKILPILSMKQ